MARSKLVVAIRRKRYHDWIALLQTLQRHVQPHHVILELGASTASRTMDLSRLAHAVIGVEFHFDRIPKPRHTAPSTVSYICDDAEHLAATDAAALKKEVASTKFRARKPCTWITNEDMHCS